jgi:hypothetical protein
MHNLKKSSHAWLVILLVAGVLALAACSATPLPPLFFAGGSGAPQPAAPVALAPAASEPAVPAVAAPPIAASQALTITAPAVAELATITETSELTATVTMTAVGSAADAVTITAPITSSVVITPAQAVEVAAVQPTATATRVAPTATRVVPTATRVAPTATRAAPTATRAPARPTATPTPEWPKTLVITADDIEQGATSVPGLQISGLDVTFGNNTMTMSFDSLRYSLVSLRNVVIQGRFVVSNGDVDFVADSISPRNLATGAIPGFINQSLDQQLSAWYVEAVTVQPGQLVATVRPR